ncbi:PREDICTED: gamma-tubulin complex component 6 [Polistes canadensis]|uniref:gamma-tubulin complex component 6 n=1 Tax=Polistes canadensis TaxID=91411 RepID=UPI000718BBD1|nr:PREDICTED: gamma-tubulin complex component 6 [Polistes canadensis]
MNLIKENSDVYHLITELSKQIFQKQCLSLEHPYLQSVNDIVKIKKLRSKAFEILLNKSKITKHADEEETKKDPVIEIYKYAFVLKLNMRRVSEGVLLESLVDDFSVNDLQRESMVYSVLQLLTKLQNYHNDQEPDLNIFYYSSSNPALLEPLRTLENVSQFPIYPIETFILSNKLDAMLDIQKCYIIQQTTANSINRSCLYNQNILKYSNKVESTRIDIGWFPIPKCITDSCSRDTISYFLPQTMTDMNYNTNYMGKCEKEAKVERDMPWSNMKFVNRYSENLTDTWRSSNESLHNEIVNVKDFYDEIWDNIDIKNTFIHNYHTWETLGELEFPKQYHFLTDTPNAMSHLTRIKQICTLLLLPKRVINNIDFPEEISTKEFVMNIKLLLLGTETKSFKYNNKIGFYMCQNIVIYGIDNETLTDICQRFIFWANCFKYLTNLTTPNSHDGKLLQEGLIFKAMCTSIKEILLHYKAALLRIFEHINEPTGLLNVLSKVQPVGLLLTEVTKLCQCSKENGKMGENSNIFAVVNKMITKVTLPQIAFVLYTILKSCCEVYFRFLQKWLFEGICHDIYGEFMIKEHSQFLRTKGPKFWTKSFTVHHESVPSFLNRLTESILQCGKAVRLLKICDPKNPVCNVFNSFQPELKVCLSVTMLREQLIKCKDYKRRGEEALGRPISLSVAIQDQKNVEREKAKLVINAQQDTLLRIKREQEEFLKTTIENKRELLKVLKEQAIEANLYKAKEKEAEMLTDRLLMEQNNQREEELYNRNSSERGYLQKYYTDLDATIQKQQARMQWCNKRMKYFDKRVAALMEEDIWKCTHVSDRQVLQSLEDNQTEGDIIPERNIYNLQHVLNNIESNTLSDNIAQEDENSNFEEVEIVEIQALKSHGVICADNINIIIRSDDETSMLANISDNKNTNKSFTVISDTQSRNLDIRLENPTNMNNIYKRNNERSSLQEFLRSEVAKELRLENDDLTNEEIHNDTKILNRPKILEINKFDNMTEAQRNKMKMLKHEFGVTPNNNQSNLFFMERRTIQDDFIIRADSLSQDNNRNYASSDVTNNTVNDQTKCINAMESIRRNSSEIVGKMNNHEDVGFFGQINNMNEIAQISSITDNLVSSVNSMMSNLPTFEDVSPLDINSSSSSSNSKLNGDVPSVFPGYYNVNISTPLVSNDNVNSSDFTSLTIADVELIDNTSLQVYLEKSIIIPLQIQSHIVNDAVIKYLLNEHNMLLHLQSLRSYFFLLNGEFAKCLTNSLYARLYEISVPIELFNSATLTNVLERALISSFSSNYMNSELLSLSAIDMPMQLHISDPHALDCLCLSYKISWPLNIILDDAVMLQYSKVFKFLLMIGRVLWVLQEDFRMMKVEHEASMSEQYHKLQLYRHSMTQFVSALHNYITCSVLHASWIEFEKDLCNSLTLDQVRFSHVNYIKRILSRCILNTRGEKMRTCLGNICKVILKFHNRLRSENWIFNSEGYTHPNFNKLEQMYEVFCELRTYLSRIAHKLTTSGYQPHLIHFLNILNINYMYDLTEKSS